MQAIHEFKETDPFFLEYVDDYIYNLNIESSKVRAKLDTILNSKEVENLRKNDLIELISLYEKIKLSLTTYNKNRIDSYRRRCNSELCNTNTTSVFKKIDLLVLQKHNMQILISRLESKFKENSKYNLYGLIFAMFLAWLLYGFPALFSKDVNLSENFSLKNMDESYHFKEKNILEYDFIDKVWLIKSSTYSIYEGYFQNKISNTGFDFTINNGYISPNYLMYKFLNLGHLPADTKYYPIQIINSRKFVNFDKPIALNKLNTTSYIAEFSYPVQDYDKFGRDDNFGVFYKFIIYSSNKKTDEWTIHNKNLSKIKIKNYFLEHGIQS